MSSFDVDVTDLTCEIELRNHNRGEIALQTEEFFDSGGKDSQHGPHEYKRVESTGFKIGKESI